MLARRVQSGLFTQEEAERCAHRLFYENVRQTFAFENWVNRNQSANLA